MRRHLSRRRILAGVGAAGVLGTAGCTDDEPNGERVEVTPVESEYDLSVEHEIENWTRYDPGWVPPETDPTDAMFETETVLESLEIPWDMEFADNGEFFVSERVGRISRYEAGALEAVTEPADVIDHAAAGDEDVDFEWWAGGSEGGLLGIALHPNYPDVPILYAFYTYEAGGDYRNRLVYYDVSADDPDETVVVDDVPGHEIIHNGARLAFGPRNYLWVTTGDAGDPELSQDTRSLAGKVLRIEPDGTVPEDNPDFPDPRIFSYGHRNPQAISFLPDGTPISSEHGDAARDEAHVLAPGENHGWPDAEDRDSYEGTDFDRPLVNTGPEETWAPSGGVFYTGDAAPALSNRFLVGGLLSQRLNVVSVYPGEAPPIGGTRYEGEWTHPEYDAVAHDLFEHELGRIRHVEQGPGGELYAITSNRDGRSHAPEEETFPRQGDDRVVRIVQE